MQCPYCGNQAKLITSTEFYGTDYGTNMYICKPCDARVGTHKNSKTPLGTMANEKLRSMRMECHKRFDPMWKSGKYHRNQAYKWLQKVMGISKKDAHIGMFDENQCEKLLHILGKELKG